MQTIAYGFVVLIVVLLAYAATRPNDFRVQRTARFNAPPDRIYPHIADFKRWAAWSPYEKLDPHMTKTLSGADFGTGAVYEWEGNAKAGKGRMQITDASPPHRLVVKLDFDKPFKAHNTSSFVLEPSGGATHVTWAMFGPSPFVAKLFGVFVNMDTMLGRDFETGLSNLKAIVET